MAYEYYDKGVFGTDPDSVTNRNVLVSPEKYFSVESESLCEMFGSFIEIF
jgi:hypothetical protein